MASQEPPALQQTDEEPTTGNNIASEERTAERECFIQKFLRGDGTGAAGHSRRTGREEEMRTTPLFSLAVKHAIEDLHKPSNHESDNGGNDGSSMDISEKSSEHSNHHSVLSQYALLGFHVEVDDHIAKEEPIFMNIAAPNSTFICGSQGSGKSFTLSTMLENCLMRDETSGQLDAPISGIVFHYDADCTGAIAEAAYLCSRGIKTSVLLSQSFHMVLGPIYQQLPGAEDHLSVETLNLKSENLSVKRMKQLMAFNEKGGPTPLYLVVLQRILREMAGQTGGASFNYQEFKKRLEDERFTKDQTSPLNLRLDLLESFMEKPGKGNVKNLFDLQPGTLTIVDLSDPFVDSTTACILFDICLGLAVADTGKTGTGLIVALDVAHKYMNQSQAADDFTAGILTAIRMQRHIATRIIVATQEPTISPALLDLCTVSIVHYFKSPDWFDTIKKHLGAASRFILSEEKQHDMFRQIMDLEVGESLLFGPSSFVRLVEGVPSKLGSQVMKMRTRLRPNVQDGGVSVLAGGKR